MKLFAAVSATAFSAVAAWGGDGHSIVAQIASDLLSSDERAKATKMADASTLAEIASWPDDIRRQAKYAWSGPLHFINNPDGTCTFDYNTACKDDKCVAGAILNFTKVAMESGSSSDAIRFVIHFMGDIAQPLHCGWTTDLGGNKIKVEEGFLGDKKTELHAVWDSGIIDRIKKDGGYSDWSDYEKVLMKDLPSDSCVTSASHDALKTCVEQIAQESLTLACKDAYRDETGKLVTKNEDLDEEYYTTRKPIVDSQLQKAGVRLGALLKLIVAGAAPGPSPGPGPSPSPSPGPSSASCKTYGCKVYKKGQDCQCNDRCKKYKNCCNDYVDVCGHTSAVVV